MYHVPSRVRPRPRTLAIVLVYQLLDGDKDLGRVQIPPTNMAVDLWLRNEQGPVGVGGTALLLDRGSSTMLEG